MTSVEITVGGRWLSLESFIGDIEMDTCWPGGSDILSWTAASLPTHRYRGGEDVRAYFGGACVWAGSLLEPDPSQDQMSATGAWREAASYVALTSAGAATAVPDTAIDQAIARGLRWTRPTSIKSSAVNIDLTQGPVKVSELLDMYADNNTVRWGVDPFRQVYAKADDTTPSYQTLPLTDGLGYSLDKYASTLYGRYFDSGTSTYKTASGNDPVAESQHGHAEDVVDLTGRGPIGAGAAAAQLASLLKLGRAVPQWTRPIELNYGELLTIGSAPAALETCSAGEVIRVYGGYDLAQRLNGAMYLDVLIGRTQLSGGTLTITPFNMVVGTLEDALVEALSKKDKAHA